MKTGKKTVRESKQRKSYRNEQEPEDILCKGNKLSFEALEQHFKLLNIIVHNRLSGSFLWHVLRVQVRCEIYECLCHSSV